MQDRVQAQSSQDNDDRLIREVLGDIADYDTASFVGTKLEKFDASLYNPLQRCIGGAERDQYLNDVSAIYPAWAVGSMYANAGHRSDWERSTSASSNDTWSTL